MRVGLDGRGIERKERQPAGVVGVWCWPAWRYGWLLGWEVFRDFGDDFSGLAGLFGVRFAFGRQEVTGQPRCVWAP